ncbi:amidase [Aliikangiella marina]|uniref:Amidase n=1 Tax=Aliikangiella marina TaxID=1712262 RepID=A0A545TBY0_9GAMM|nr:amidase [Aliikangiella marina]TQV74714.1 amidase [Aliikangiella marina]
MGPHSLISFTSLKTLSLSALLSLNLVISGCEQSTAIPENSETPKQNEDFSALIEITENSTIPQLQQLMRDGQLSAEQLTAFYLAQIAQKNELLNAVITTNPEALEIAKQLDALATTGKFKGPLHGIPILVKDNIETQTMATTAGSLILKDNYTNRDAMVIQKLKAAGAIILGKTNLSEWANIRSERSSSGWSAMGGQTKNPHDVTRSPCGSSSGSGSAVAANLSVATIGTETNGSITCPSSANGIVGLKPTVGSVSRTGIVPISHTQDTAGPMSKSVTDAAIILQAIQGKDDADNATQILADGLLNIRLPDESFQLKGKRIGVLFSRAMNHEGVAAAFDRIKQSLKSQGAILVEDLTTTPYQGFYGDTYQVLLYEFKHDLNQYLSRLPNDKNQLTLEKIIAFNEQNKQQEMKYFQQEVFIKSQAKGPLTEPEYIDALAKIRKATREDGLDKLMTDNNLDIIISATLGPAWKIDLINGDNFGGSFSTYPAVSGYPHLTLPMGKVHGLPVGLSLTAGPLSEQKLLDFGYAIEKINL